MCMVVFYLCFAGGWWSISVNSVDLVVSFVYVICLVIV